MVQSIDKMTKNTIDLIKNMWNNTINWFNRINDRSDKHLIRIRSGRYEKGFDR